MKWLNKKELRNAVDTALDNSNYQTLIVVNDKMTRELAVTDLIKELIHQITIGKTDNNIDFEFKNEPSGFKIQLNDDGSFFYVLLLSELYKDLECNLILVDENIDIDEVMKIGGSQTEIDLERGDAVG